jgi:hypothetical protein
MLPEVMAGNHKDVRRVGIHRPALRLPPVVAAWPPGHLAALPSIGLSLLQDAAFLWDQAEHEDDGASSDPGGGRRDGEQHADQGVGRPAEDAVSCE